MIGAGASLLSIVMPASAVIPASAGMAAEGQAKTRTTPISDPRGRLPVDPIPPKSKELT
jgi:hypothetical protein